MKDAISDNRARVDKVVTSEKSVLSEPDLDLVYAFKISRKASGNFKNLWKLEVKTPTDNGWVEVVDADLLSTVLGKVHYVFEADGL